MLTALSALAGFASSLIPEVTRLFKEGRDQKHELAMIRLQGELAEKQSSLRLQELDLQATIAENTSLPDRVKPMGIVWVDALNGAIRPLLTIYVNLLIGGCVLGRLVWQVDIDPWLWGAVETLWGATNGYWFGNRTILHNRKG